MASHHADGILYPSITLSWGSSAKFFCDGVLCRQKPLSWRGRVHRPTQLCDLCYDYELRLECGLPIKDQ